MVFQGYLAISADLLRVLPIVCHSLRTIEPHDFTSLPHHPSSTDYEHGYSETWKACESSHRPHRIFLILLKRGESKGLFDLAQSLLKGAIGNEYKGAQEKEKEWRIACAYCLGEIYLVHGSQVSRFLFLRFYFFAEISISTTFQVMSLYIEIMTVMTRIYKTS